MAKTAPKPPATPPAEKARRSKRASGDKARVAPERARVKLKSKADAALTRALPPPQQTTWVLATRNSQLAIRRHRRPLFVLATARRRRARGGAVRGGYYGLSSA